MSLYSNQKTTSKGFSLVELSVVVIIVSLVIGGVFAGGKLVESSRITKLVAEIENYQTTFELFAKKYQAIPGDMIDATIVLPDGGSTANGDGNGSIAWPTTGDAEALRAWQHLSLANMLDVGNLAGTETDNIGIIGETIPQSSAIRSLGYGLSNDVYTNDLILGGNDGELKNDAWVFTPRNAKTIDSKIDDGIGSTGSLRGYGSEEAVHGGDTICLDTTDYNLDIDTPKCHLVNEIRATL